MNRHQMQRRRAMFPHWLRNEMRNRLGNGGPPRAPRCSRISTDADTTRPEEIFLNYDDSLADDAVSKVGTYIAGEPLTNENSYFEVEILNCSESSSIVVGVAWYGHDLGKQPGCAARSIGFHCIDGKIHKNDEDGQAFGPPACPGDRVGCGVRSQLTAADASADLSKPADSIIFFTINGQEIGAERFFALSEGYHPAVSMSSPDDVVHLCLRKSWSLGGINKNVELMSVDSHDDDWCRLYSVRQNGLVLEYVGKGKSIHDVGLAQAKLSLSTTNHYFEIEIIEPGDNCYIAIGLARKDYPKDRHPGWNAGSIAYHADDGKVFVGTGVGDDFGPRCQKGDTMGCGILFPRESNHCTDDNSESNDDSEDEFVCHPGGAKKRGDKSEPKKPAAVPSEVPDASAINSSTSTSSSGDESADAVNGDDGHYLSRNGVAMADCGYVVGVVPDFVAVVASMRVADGNYRRIRKVVKARDSATCVQVYFTKNGKLVGKRDACMPNGEYYPTIGMLSCGEKVQVDLRPLTG